MREIKFRGRSTSTNDWIFGYLIVIDNKYFIFQQNATIKCIGRYGDDNFGEISQSGQDYITQVHSDSIGQYTGLKDKNWIEIYEGDIVKCDHIQGYSWEKSYTDIGVIEFSKGGFALKCKAKGKENAKDISKRYFFLNFKDDRIFESIGNIYENPELLP